MASLICHAIRYFYIGFCAQVNTSAEKGTAKRRGAGIIKNVMGMTGTINSKVLQGYSCAHCDGMEGNLNHLTVLSETLDEYFAMRILADEKTGG